MLLQTDAFTQTFLHTESVSHRNFYTQTLLHTDPFTHRRFRMQTLLHTRAFYTQARLHRRFAQRRCCTQTLLYTEAFTHRRFYTQLCLHTESFSCSTCFPQTLYTLNFLNTYAFTQGRFIHIYTLTHMKSRTFIEWANALVPPTPFPERGGI